MADLSPAPEPLSADQQATKVAVIQRRLLDWFDANGRELPWRHTRDPYRILVSEVMLQQTQVDRVIPYYHAFLERFPTLGALAQAPAADVITAWAGLGYNRRAVNLQRTARAILDEHDGRFPESLDALRRLPGIGPYTAGAIACFAFEQPAAFLDTNMRRVLHRLFFGSDVPTPVVPEAALLRIAEAAVPPGNAWSWNQALIEFGALQCTARRPACVVCPLQASCDAYPTVQSALASLPRGSRAPSETPFTSSNRYYRGRVVDVLRELATMGTDRSIEMRELGETIRDGFSDDDIPWLYGLVTDLARDGLAVAAEESPAYDTATERPDAATLRVRLP